MEYKAYFERFNFNDEETVSQLYPNDKASDFLYANAPRLYCPDEVIEETFAFRTWTIRKHLMMTDDGLLMSEFLPKVGWSGRHNTINAALFHHLNEYRWFADASRLLDYVSFFVENKAGNAFRYSTPALTAIREFCDMTGNSDYLTANADKLEAYYKQWETEHITASGLYWSLDNYDAMEMSISGTTPDLKYLRGLRPTMNSYMYGDALALAEILERTGDSDKAAYYREKAANIRKLVNERLWDGFFYKAVHVEDVDRDPLSWKNILPGCNVREEIGYIPWAYCLPDEGMESAFALLKDENCFKGVTGFTTADKSHPRYLYESKHECLWNGYVWPFATSQTLNSVISLLNNYKQDVITNSDLYDFIRTYTDMHYITDEDGKVHSFIDEVMYPDKRVWSAREVLKDMGWLPNKGGYERGKDYNHSTFIDIVLRGLVGVDITADSLTVKPRIGGIWKWFKVENLSFKGNRYTVYYDEDGSHFGKGTGIVIEKN
nr:hypothetical protein [Clostridia bacterium]